MKLKHNGKRLKALLGRLKNFSCFFKKKLDAGFFKKVPIV